MTFAGLAAALVLAPRQPPKDATPAVKDTPAAEFTRTKLLKAKVTVGYSAETPVGEILKEFAHQAEMQADGSLMWAYGPGFAFGKKVAFAAKGLPLDEALDQLLLKAGGGYVVVSRDGDKYDGWVRLTTGTERGVEPPPPNAAEEAEAASKLGLAKKLLDAGKPDSARPVLEIVARKYPTTRAGAEARDLLGKLEKDK